MKRSILLFLLACSLLAYSHTITDIMLSNMSSQQLMGVWTNGDYGQI